jgi:hypothetical protein
MTRLKNMSYLELQRIIASGLSDVSTLEEAVGKAQAAVSEASDGVSAAENAYRTGLLAENGDLVVLDEARRLAAVALDRARAVAKALADKLDAAKAAAAEDHRRTRYEAAARAAEAAEKALSTKYPAAAVEIASVVQQVKEATELVREANSDRPAGAPELQDPEAVVRGLIGLPEEVVRVEKNQRWCEVGSLRPLSEEEEKRVVKRGDDKGFLDNMSVILVTFKTVWYKPQVPAREVALLCGAVRLPGLRAGDPPFCDRGVINPTLPPAVALRDPDRPIKTRVERL